jgi:hypothetical protein
MKIFKYLSLSTIILALFFLFGTAIKLVAIDQYNTSFTYDQGRDMVDIRHMYSTISPKLVGPTTSINGVLLGPFWYYFNLPAFIIGGGSPIAISIWNIVAYQLAILFFYAITRRYLALQSLIISVLLFIAPSGFYTARYFWNANSAPIFVLLFFALLVPALFSKTQKWPIYLWIGLLAGITLQVEAAFGVLLIPFALLCLVLYRKKLRDILITLSGFSLTLIPQILFEIRHSFPMTRVFLAQISGADKVLGETVAFSDRLIERYSLYLHEIYKLSHIPADITTVIFVISLIIVLVTVIKPKFLPVLHQSRFTQVSLLFVIFTIAFYLLYPMQVKYWYVLGVHVPLIFVFSSLFVWLAHYPRLYPILFLILSFAVFHTVKAQTEYFRDYTYTESTNPSLIRNQIEAIDWIYASATESGFRVYNYVPAIYDYQWNYLFWWQGNHRYHPIEVAYRPDQPAYIVDQALIFDRVRETEEEYTYLIMEQDGSDRLIDWRHHFDPLCQVDQTTISKNLVIHKLSVCQR